MFLPGVFLQGTRAHALRKRRFPLKGFFPLPSFRRISKKQLLRGHEQLPQRFQKSREILHLCGKEEVFLSRLPKNKKRKTAPQSVLQRLPKRLAEKRCLQTVPKHPLGGSEMLLRRYPQSPAPPVRRSESQCSGVLRMLRKSKGEAPTAP
jgi:hypothetical protein